MLPAVVFNIAGSSILLNIFHGVRAHITRPLISVENKFSFCGKVGLKFNCFDAEHCEHAPGFLLIIVFHYRHMTLSICKGFSFIFF